MKDQERDEVIIFILGCNENWLPFDIPVNRNNAENLIRETEEYDNFKKYLKDMTVNQFIERLNHG